MVMGEPYEGPHWRYIFCCCLVSLPSWKLTYPFSQGVIFLKMIFRPLPGYYTQTLSRNSRFLGVRPRDFNLLEMPGEDIFKGPSQHLPRILKAELSWFKNCRKVNAGCCECCLTWSFFGMLMFSTSDFKKTDRRGYESGVDITICCSEHVTGRLGVVRIGQSANSHWISGKL